MSDPIDTNSMADRLPDASEQARSEYETAMAECEGISTPLKCASAFKEAVEWGGAVALDKAVELVAPTYESEFGKAINKDQQLDTLKM